MIHFREADKDDIALIQDLTMKVWPQTYANILTPDQVKYMLEMMYSKSSLENQITVRHHRFVIGYDGKEPVAFASFSPKSESDSIVWKVHKIYILPGQQGKGIGKKFIDHISQQVILNGGSELELNVNRHNRAKSFYEKIGFIQSGQEDIDIGGGYLMNDCIMALKLIH